MTEVLFFGLAWFSPNTSAAPRSEGFRKMEASPNLVILGRTEGRQRIFQSQLWQTLLLLRKDQGDMQGESFES